MRLHDGRYECAYCRAVLDVPLVADPQVTIRARSGMPNRRSLMMDGQEIHACDIDPQQFAPTRYPLEDRNRT